MLRLLFEKTGNAVWMSHLDLMRVFQRAFKRAGLSLTHTQGFNPRPSVSIALPLSVGVESVCELLDFELNGETVSVDDICSRGGTFYHSAKALLAAGAASIALYVTHLEETVFLGDLTPELIDRIYTTPSIFPRKRVEDIKAADGENWIDIMNEYD